MTETRYATTWWTSLDDGRIRCDVCSRACALHDGQAGLCFVRMRAGDQIVLTTYGRSSGFLRGSHREEAAEPLLAWDVGALLRHGRLQSRLPLLPELGHL